MQCHEQEAWDFMKTVHWTWESQPVEVPGHDGVVATIGKKNQINNFCIGIRGNENKCNACHAGYGWEDETTFDFNNPLNVDCLICHAEKYPTRKVTTIDTPQGKAQVFTLDPEEAKQAALTINKKMTNEQCMRCHEHAMQGDKYKRLTPITPETDVHAAKGMTCLDCHKVKDHLFAKGKAATDLVTNDLPDVDVSCAGCHTEKPHKNNAILNMHTSKLACEACHIKDTARSIYDWSKIVLDKKTGYYGPTIIHEPGKVTWRWFNGTGTGMAAALSSKGDIYPGKKGNPPEDKITPFRGFNQVFPVDKNNPFFLLPFDLKTLKETGDADKALKVAMNSPYMKMLYSKKMEPLMQKLAGQFGMKWNGGPWKGQYMYVPMPKDATISINHAITKQGRSCSDCHSPNGIMDWKGLGYSDEEIKKLTSIAQ